MDKEYYIVPTTRSYYEKIKAEGPGKAITTFAENMDTDMNAYFIAVSQNPINCISGYRNPEDDFSVAMTILADTLAGKDNSKYYDKEVLDKCDLTTIEAVHALQEAYDAMAKTKPSGIRYVGDDFYRILKNLTGISVGDEDEEEYDDSTMSARITVSPNDGEWGDVLASEFIDYDIDSGDRIMLYPSTVDNAVEALEEAGYDVDIL